MQILRPITIRPSYHGKTAFSVVERDGKKYTVSTLKTYRKSLATSISQVVSEPDGAIVTEGTTFWKDHGKLRATEKNLKTLCKEAITEFFEQSL